MSISAEIGKFWYIYSVECDTEMTKEELFRQYCGWILQHDIEQKLCMEGNVWGHSQMGGINAWW